MRKVFHACNKIVTLKGTLICTFLRIHSYWTHGILIHVLCLSHSFVLWRIFIRLMSKQVLNPTEGLHWIFAFHSNKLISFLLWIWITFSLFLYAAKEYILIASSGSLLTSKVVQSSKIAPINIRRKQQNFFLTKRRKPKCYQQMNDLFSLSISFECISIQTSNFKPNCTFASVNIQLAWLTHLNWIYLSIDRNAARKYWRLAKFTLFFHHYGQLL